MGGEQAEETAPKVLSYEDRAGAAIDACRTDPEAIGRRRQVYFVHAGGFFKIGIARDPSRRLPEIQTGCPFKVRCTTPFRWGGRVAERAIHQAVQEWRSEGGSEWFISEWQAYSMAMMIFLTLAPVVPEVASGQGLFNGKEASGGLF